MSRLTNYIKEVSAQARQRSSSLYHSRLLRFGFLATLASAFVMPMLLPVMASLFLVAPLLYHGAMSLARPLMDDFSLRDTRHSLSSFFNRGTDRATVVSHRGGDSHGRSEEQARKAQSSPSALSGEASVPRGRKTGEPMVDFLIKRLRDAGMTVTTDWKRSREFLDTLPDKYDSLKHNQRKMYGFVYEGIIHINPSKKALETPLHEYTHIWAEVLRQKNTDEWKNIVGLMKQESQLWDSVCKSYPHLETDDEIADEVLATYSGKRGAELLRQHYQQGDAPGKTLNGVMEALKAFWNGVCGFFKVDFSDKDEIADTILSDFLHGVKLMDDLDKNRQTLSDRMPLSQLAESPALEDVLEEVGNINRVSMRQKNHDVVLLSGNEARMANEDILDSIVDDGNSVHYPAQMGVVGYYPDKNDDGNEHFIAFDNRDGYCWQEEFATADGAREWLKDGRSADEIHCMEAAQVENILLSKDSFPALRGDTEHCSMPPNVVFDENGEYEVKLRFRDGYAHDLSNNLVYDKLALYYPTLAEVKADRAMQDEITRFTGRQWSKGSEHEKIYDIAVTFGQASRYHCPQERIDAAIQAIVERASVPSARSFTAEQRDKIELSCASNGNDIDVKWRKTFFDSLYYRAQEQMKGVPIAWAQDAHEELNDLAKGIVRGQELGLHR